MKKITIVAIGLTLTSVSIPAFANEASLIVRAPSESSPTPVIKVKSDRGENWDTVDRSENTRFEVGYTAKCQFKGKGNKAYRSTLSVDGFKRVSKLEPPNYLTPDKNVAHAKYDYIGNGDFDPVKVCRHSLYENYFQNEGKGKYKYLSTGVKIPVKNAVNATYELRCLPQGGRTTGKATQSTPLDVIVECMPSEHAKSKIPPETASFVPLVKNVHFSAKGTLTGETCQARVALSGTITANRAGTVKYQYISSDNKKSPEFELVFNKAGTKPIRKRQRVFSQKKTQATLSTGAAKNLNAIDGYYTIKILEPSGVGDQQSKFEVQCPTKAKLILPDL